jgi:hypothetical protein
MPSGWKEGENPMKRNAGLILIPVVAVATLLFLFQSVTRAQETNPQDEPPNTLQPTAVDEVETPVSSLDDEPPVLAPEDISGLVSSAFTYQGKLNNNGMVVNSNCDFIWNIYADSSGGSSLATDTDTNLLVANGLFTAVVNVPASVIDGNARFVEIQVRCPTGSGAYTTLSPRQELFAAPYALGLRLPFSHTINSSASPVFSITNSGGTGSSPSLQGSSVGSNGVNGLSTGGASADNGVYGETNSTTTSEGGVKGVSTAAAAGGYFTSSSGYGVYGSASSVTGFGGYFTNSTTTTSGGALYANGDAKQSLAGDGFVKAGVYVDCGNTSSLIIRSFNNVNTTAITVINGTVPGRCTVDFGFNVSNRYLTATAFGNGVPRIVTYIQGSTDNRLDFFRFDENMNGLDGGIMILIY